MRLMDAPTAGPDRNGTRTVSVVYLTTTGSKHLMFVSMRKFESVV